MNSTTMPSYEELLSISFHKEKIKSKRLAQKMEITAKQALQLILLQSLNQHNNQTTNSILDEQYLCQLVIERTAFIQKQTASKVEQRKKSIERHQLKKQKNLIPNKAWCLWFDGSAKPNPGKCSIGVVLQSPDGKQRKISQKIADGDSSDAEYQALIAGLLMAVKLASSANIKLLYVIGDSQVVLNDVQNLTINSSLILKEYRIQAQSLINQLTHVVFLWKPRHSNAQADALALSAQLM